MSISGVWAYNANMPPDLPPHILAYVESLEASDEQALVAVFDRDGYYLYASANHEQILDYTADELLRLHLSQVVEESQHHAAWVLRTVSVFHTKPLPFSTRLVAKSGQLVPISGILRHIHRPGGERYFVTVVKPVPHPPG